MKIKVTVVVDPEDGTPPLRNELWRNIDKAEVRDFQFPETPSELHYPEPISYQHAWMQFERQADRNKNYVRAISNEIAQAFGRALGDRPERR